MNSFFEEVKALIVDNFLCASTAEEEVEEYIELVKECKYRTPYEKSIMLKEAESITDFQFEELKDIIRMNEIIYEEKNKENLGGFKILDNRGRKVVRLY